MLYLVLQKQKTSIAYDQIALPLKSHVLPFDFFLKDLVTASKQALVKFF